MNVDGDIVDDSCEERCSVMESSGKMDADEGDGVKNEGNKSSTIRVNTMVITDSGVACW